MISRSIGRMCAAAVVIGSIATNASETEAFEYSGFYSGMPMTEIEQSAKELGWKLQPMKGQDDVFELVFENQTVFNFSMCNDRLFAINRTVSGGIDAFASRVSELNAKYGKAAGVIGNSSYGSHGLLSIVQIEWKTPSGERRGVSILKSGATNWANYSYGAHDVVCR